MPLERLATRVGLTIEAQDYSPASRGPCQSPLKVHTRTLCFEAEPRYGTWPCRIQRPVVGLIIGGKIIEAGL
jgi:hypothetical protein